MLVAVVNDRMASSGIAAALLPVRKADFFGFFEMSSRIEGNSGDEEITTSESLCAILAGEDGSGPPDALVDEVCKKEQMRQARPSLTATFARNDTVENWSV